MSTLGHLYRIPTQSGQKNFLLGLVMPNWVDKGKNVGSKLSVVTILGKSLDGDRDPNIVKWVSN